MTSNVQRHVEHLAELGLYGKDEKVIMGVLRGGCIPAAEEWYFFYMPGSGMGKTVYPVGKPMTALESQIK